MAVMDETDRNRIEVMPLLPAVSTGRDQTGHLEDAEMLHDPEPRHLG
jgi:hypothetical protein